MKYDRKNTNDTDDRRDERADERRETPNEQLPTREAAAPSQQSQKMPFSAPEKSRSKDDEIERAIEDRDEEFRREDQETNKSGDPRIGTHDRNY